jgi:hypothetical protein
MKIEEIAKVCFEANEALCEIIGDTSAKSWEEASEITKNSIIVGVKLYLTRPTSTPMDAHNAWLDYKRAEGWVWGEEKDEVKKTHPNLVTFDQLPLEQKAKDYLFISVVNSLRMLLPPPQMS